MGQCKFCGQPAGFLRRQHQECKDHYTTTVRQIRAVSANAIASQEELSSLRSKVEAMAKDSHVPLSVCHDQIVAAWEQTVEGFLEDGELSEVEENIIVSANDALELTQNELDKNGAYTRLVRAGALRDILQGRPSTRFKFEGLIPFNLQKSEVLLWIFPNTRYLEDRTRREYRGGHSGVSIRLMKGVYYRTGTFRGHPVDTVQRTHVDTGLFGVTNKHVYFVGPKKSLRIRHDKIVSLTPFEDGVGIHRDAQSAKPQIFITGDGWFTYNLLCNAQQVETPSARAKRS